MAHAHSWHCTMHHQDRTGSFTCYCRCDACGLFAKVVTADWKIIEDDRPDEGIVETQ